MKNNTQTEVLIVGGSYAGLAAAMSLGRAMRQVVVLDSGMPCNWQTPHSHNFITQDGETPAAIRAKAREQVFAYPTVLAVEGKAIAAEKLTDGFAVTTEAGATITARKIIFATGVRDILPALPGFAACWGISVLHCPYCHGYEVRGQQLGVLGNGDMGYEFALLLRNWSAALTLLTNRPATLTASQAQKLREHGVVVVESELQSIVHQDGQMQQVTLQDGTALPLDAIFARVPFEQHSELPAVLGCALTEMGHIQVDDWQNTTIPGIYAVGDATTPMRALAVAVASGTKAGSFVNHALIQEDS